VANLGRWLNQQTQAHALSIALADKSREGLALVADDGSWLLRNERMRTLTESLETACSLVDPASPPLVRSLRRLQSRWYRLESTAGPIPGTRILSLEEAQYDWIPGDSASADDIDQLSRTRRIEDLERDALVYQHFDEGELVADPINREPIDSQLLKRNPALFCACMEIYERLLEQRLEERTYHVQHGTSMALVGLSRRLCEGRATPRDIIEIHSLALRRICAGVPDQKSAAYTNEGRVMVLELMGRLAAAYRQYALRPPTEEHPT
jgi:hypothetical protein